MPSRPQLPPPNLLIQELRTPNPSDIFFRELVDRSSARWQEANPIKRGTLYSSLRDADKAISALFPHLYFLSETVPIGSNTVAGMTQADLVIWSWMTAPAGESPTNAEISLLADAVTNPVFARVYTVLRETYEASPYALTGQPFTGLLAVRAVRGGTGYTNATCTLVGPGSDSDALVTPVIADGVITHFIVEREGIGFDSTSTIQVIGDGIDAEGLIILQPVAAVLTSQKKVELADDDPRQSQFVKVLKVYELLPGPYIPVTRYDDDLGPIQGRARAVLNTGQLGGIITPTGKRNYQGRDGSSVVSMEIEENWSDGTGTPNNPPYPILVLDDYERGGEGRGTYQRTSQIVRATGSEIGSLDRSFPFITKTSYEPYADNPYLLKKIIETWTEVTRSDREVTSQFGGGELRVDTSTAEPGVLSVDIGKRIIESALQTTSPHEQRKQTKQLIVGEWPPLHGFHTDEVTGIVVNFTKQVVDEGIPYPGRDITLYRGPFIEMQTYDRWRSIQITSKVDLNTLPGPESWFTTHPFFLPPTLLSVEAVWTDVKSKLTQALTSNGGFAHVAVGTGSNGSYIARRTAGFRGKAKAIQARFYKFGSPSTTDIPQPLKILPTSGSIVFTSTKSDTNYANYDDGGVSFGDGFTIAVHAGDISDHLVGPNLQIINPTHTSPPQSASATSPGGNIAAVSAAGTVSYMSVQIPYSTPQPQLIPSGTQILYDVIPEEWRFGIWQIDLIYVIIP